MLTRIKLFPVSNYKQDDIYRNKNSSAFLQKKIQDIVILFHDFPGRVVTLHQEPSTKITHCPVLDRESFRRCSRTASELSVVYAGVGDVYGTRYQLLLTLAHIS